MRFITSYPPGWEHCHVDETASTMLALQHPPYANATAPFLLLTANYQTAGRGQRGTHWEAARGENLLFGIRLHPHTVRPSRQFCFLRCRRWLWQRRWRRLWAAFA